MHSRITLSAKGNSLDGPLLEELSLRLKAVPLLVAPEQQVWLTFFLPPARSCEDHVFRIYVGVVNFMTLRNICTVHGIYGFGCRGEEIAFLEGVNPIQVGLVEFE